MSQNLDTLFTGHFYIDKPYAAGLIPALISIYTGKNLIEKTEVDKIKDVTHVYLSTNSTTADVNSALNDSSNKVVVLDFKQPVVKYSTYYWLGTQSYIRILERLKNDPTVLGVVVDTDTGGGQVYGTPEMYDAVADFKKVKPIGFYTNGYLCSGGYYIAAPSSFIMANRRADAIGSIGAYTNIVDYDGLLEKFGAKVHTIYSDLSPDKNKGYRGVVDGTDPDYKKYIKEELNPMVLTFHADMKAARPQLKEVVFKGGTWTGSDSIEMGLVDSNGSLQDAITKVFELASSDNKNSNKNKSNLKPKTMSKKTKSFPAIQSIIGIEGEGIATISTVLGNKGVQLTESQLEKIEASIASHEAAITEERTKVTTAEGKVTGIETAINTAITTAGLNVGLDTTATSEVKVTLLGSKVVEYGKRSGAIATTPKADGDQFEEKDSIAIETDAHNEFYNKA